MMDIQAYGLSVAKALAPRYSRNVAVLLQKDTSTFSEEDVDTLVRHFKFLAEQGEVTDEMQAIAMKLDISENKLI